MPDTEQSLIDTQGIPEVELLVEVLNAPEILMEVEVLGMTKTEVDKTLSIDDCAADAKATGDAIADLAADIANLSGEIDSKTADDIPFYDTAGSDSVKKVVEDLENNLENDIQDLADDISAMSQQIYDVYPVGSIYIDSSNVAPSFPGTYWEEVVISATVAQLTSGTVNFVAGTGAGPIHYWRRIQEPVP